jgi:hypothetical protein
MRPPTWCNGCGSSARRNLRSLQGDMLAMIEAAVRPAEPKRGAEEFLMEIRKLGFTRRHEAANLVREDRDAGHQRSGPAGS